MPHINSDEKSGEEFVIKISDWGSPKQEKKTVVAFCEGYNT